MTDDMRAAIRTTVSQYPGLHVRELARQNATSVALVSYHLKHLEKEGAIVRESDDRLHRIFPAGMAAPDRRMLAALREPRRLQVVQHLLTQGPCKHGALVEATGMGKSTISFHLRRLERGGLVANGPDGYVVRRPGHVGALIQAHRPTPEVRDDFAALWDDLYG